MKALFVRTALVAAAASISACSTGIGGAPPPTDVTRFHLGQQIARGQIAIEAVDPANAGSLEFRSHADAVARQLTRLGWTVTNAGTATEQVALINVEQGSREAMRQRSPVSIGIGGGTGGRNVGVGGGVNFGVGGGGAREVVGTLLEVRMKRRSEGTVFWEGRATTEARAGAPEAQRAIAVEKLADALFRDFPGESGRTIRVR
jgi:hypothetical protein